MLNNGRSNPRPRIESLSDLIFGLALSLSAYSLLSRPPTQVSGMASDIIEFTFSFVILIFVWLRYTEIMSVLPIENRTTRTLNVFMLFAVSLEPYLFNLVSLFGHSTETEIVQYASFFYSLDMAVLVVILAVFTNELAREEKQLIAPELMKPYKKVRNFMLLSAGLFIFSMLPQFWMLRIQNIPLRFLLWMVPLAVIWVGSIPTEKAKSPNNICGT